MYISGKKEEYNTYTESRVFELNKPLLIAKYQ